MSNIETITIGIGVKNVAESVEWYKKLLGEVKVVEPTPGTIELQLNESIWLQLDDTGYLEVGGGSAIIRLSKEDIEATHENVRSLASDVDNIETVEGVISYFDFKDPDGNRLSYYKMVI